MSLRAMNENDWMLLKQVRLAALLDTLTAFGVSYTTSAELTTRPKSVFNGDRILANVRERQARQRQSDRKTDYPRYSLASGRT